MSYKAYSYRMYPTKEQAELIEKTFGCVRFVFNHFLEDRITAYKEHGESRTFYQQNLMLTDLKKEYPWLQEPDKNALQYAVKNVDVAYRKFFDGKGGYPNFKSKYKSVKSYSTGNTKNIIRFDGNKLHLPKLGWVKVALSRELPQNARIVKASISETASGKYFASLGVETDEEPPTIDLDRSKSVGLDYSSPHFYVDSNGESADMPHFFRIAEEKLAREQKKLSKMQRGGKNYEKQRKRVAILHEKVANCRKDWQHKESTRLADKYDIISVEDINYQDMSQSLKLGKATKDNSFGRFRGFLDYKTAERGKKLIVIDKWYPSSKTCRFCGYVNKELKLGQKEWDCPNCGKHLLRDENAAINIRDQGLSML